MFDKTSKPIQYGNAISYLSVVVIIWFAELLARERVRGEQATSID